jgi:predicted small lipoprotein YifL
MAFRDSIKAAGFTVALLAIAGCGSRDPLRPAPGQSMPVAPATASSTPTTEQLLTPPPIARPDRLGERLRRSEPRQDDRFDLPPP